jgi:hypothetical protein
VVTRSADAAHAAVGRRRSPLDLVVETGPERRFLTRRMAAALGLYLLFALTFASFSVNNDGLVYYNFLRRFLGEEVPTAYASQFAGSFFNIPFYLAAKVVEGITGLSSVFGASIEEFSIGVASNVALVLTLCLGWRLLTELDLPAGPAVLLLTLFGTPLLYYTAFQPEYKHAVDALLVTLLAYLVLRITQAAEPGQRLLIAAGACLGTLVIVRYANVALVGLALIPLLLRRRPRDAALLSFAALAAIAVLLALPPLRGMELSRAQQEGAAPVQTAGLGQWIVDKLCADEPVKVNLEQCLHNTTGVYADPLVPAKMLFTVKRGLFLWTPLTALAVVGFALLFRSRPERRAFLIGLAVGAVLLVAIHAFWSDFWTGGFSFSQRFLSSLFPLFLLGTAELIRRRRGLAVAALSACAVFSTLLAFTIFFGYQGQTEDDGLDDVLQLYVDGERTAHGLARTAGVHALERWGLR